MCVSMNIHLAGCGRFNCHHLRGARCCSPVPPTHANMLWWLGAVREGRAGCSRRRRRPRAARRRCSPASGRALSRGCWRAWRAARPRTPPLQALSKPHKTPALETLPLRKAALKELSTARRRLPAGGGRCVGAGMGMQRRSASCASCARSRPSGAGSCHGFLPRPAGWWGGAGPAVSQGNAAVPSRMGYWSAMVLS